ncbi:hypothetical protein YB2330_004462 [Saitoella coloradoensis]
MKRHQSFSSTSSSNGDYSPSTSHARLAHQQQPVPVYRGDQTRPVFQQPIYDGGHGYGGMAGTMGIGMDMYDPVSSATGVGSGPTSTYDNPLAHLASAAASAQASERATPAQTQIQQIQQLPTPAPPSSVPSVFLSPIMQSQSHQARVPVPLIPTPTPTPSSISQPVSTIPSYSVPQLQRQRQCQSSTTVTSRATPASKRPPKRPSLTTTTSTTPAPPGTGAGEGPRTEHSKAKRRVPPSLRKRTQISCDACKTRRCKCVRTIPPDIDTTNLGVGEGESGSKLPPCKLCLESGIECVSSLPRKVRVYGTTGIGVMGVEGVRRWRALEALVKGVFPDIAATDGGDGGGRGAGAGTSEQGQGGDVQQAEDEQGLTAEKILAFGRSMGVDMPDLEALSEGIEGGVPPAKEGEKGPVASIVIPPATLAAAPAPSTTTTTSTTTTGAVGAGGATGLKGAVGMRTPGGPRVKEDTSLIKDTSGRPHYIGPSGSLAFFAKLRELVAQRSSSSPSGNQGGNRGTGDRFEFVRDKLAGALDGGMMARGTPAGAGPGLGGLGMGIGIGSVNASAIPSRAHSQFDPDSRIASPGSSDDEDNPDNDHDATSPESSRSANTGVELPVREQADRCVDAFFRLVHPNYVLFHRASFQGTYESLYRQKRRSGTSVPSGWLCCLYMVLVFGSRMLPQEPGSLEFQRRWFRAAHSRLPHLLTTSTLPNVCALLLLALYAHNANDRNSAWTLVGAAGRLAIALGMHRASASVGFEPLRRELRKRVWWTLYQFEQFLCCGLGRPSAIEDAEVDIGVPSEELLDGGLAPPLYLEHASRLYMLYGSIRRGVYHPTHTGPGLVFRAKQIMNSLRAWEGGLPGQLRSRGWEEGMRGSQTQWRSVVMLHVQYQHALALLTRPFLLQAANSNSTGGGAVNAVVIGKDDASVKEMREVCVTASVRCGELLVELWRAGCLNGISWLDVFYVYSSSMILSLALFAQMSSSNGNGAVDFVPPHDPDELRRRVSQLLQVMESVRMCGTMVRFAKVAEDFAKVVGITSHSINANAGTNHTSSTTGTGVQFPAVPTDPYGPFHLAINIPTNTNNNNGYATATATSGTRTSWDPHAAGDWTALGGMESTFAGIFAADPSLNVENHGHGITTTTGSGGEGGMEWDMVMQPSEWNEAGGLAMQMDWGWQWAVEAAAVGI